MWHMRRILRQIGALQDKMDKRRLQTILDQREHMEMPSPSRNVPLIAHRMLLFSSVLIGGTKGNMLRNCTIIKPRSRDSGKSRHLRAKRRNILSVYGFHETKVMKNDLFALCSRGEMASNSKRFCVYVKEVAFPEDYNWETFTLHHGVPRLI